MEAFPRRDLGGDIASEPGALLCPGHRGVSRG